MREHAALVQHHHVVAGAGFVDEMRRPEHADALLHRQPANVIENVGARLDVETDGRFVQQQQPRLVQQRAGNLDPPHLPDRKIPDAIEAAIGHRHAIEHLGDQFIGALAGDAVQCRVIHQVLPHRNVDIERAGLKHHAELAQAPHPARSPHRGRKSGSDPTGSHRGA